MRRDGQQLLLLHAADERPGEMCCWAERGRGRANIERWYEGVGLHDGPRCHRDGYSVRGEEITVSSEEHNQHAQPIIEARAPTEQPENRAPCSSLCWYFFV